MLNVLEYTCKMCEEDMYTCLHGVLYIFHNKLTLFIVSKYMASHMSLNNILLQSTYVTGFAKKGLIRMRNYKYLEIQL